ncbi:MAG: tetratricopeptide repeat protein, partial [Bdellovibrionota bacterium]
MMIWGGLVADVGAQSPEMDEATRRAKLFEIYQKQIPLLEQFVSKYPFSERTPDSLFRLGEAYFESAKYFQASDSQTKASVYNQKAIETLEGLRVSHSQYERSDEVLYVLASAYLDAGQTERAGPVLSDLARRFPNSEILNTAASILGDFYFEKSDFAQAKVFYQKAQANPDRASYAHYKLAWIAIQQLQPALALKHFTESLAVQSSSSVSFDYSKEIAREMIWPALEVYGAQGVLGYLDQALPSSELHQMALATLAEGLSSKGEPRLASEVYEHLTAKYSSSPQISEWLTKYLENEEKLGRSDKISELVSRLSGAAKGSPEVKAKLFASARKAHAMAQAEKNSAQKATQYDQAIAYYQSFLQFETDQAKKAEMEFYLGEALFARDRFQEALQAYKSAAQIKNEKQSVAAWNWYLTAEKIAPGFRFEAKHQGTLTVQDEMFLEAARYVSQFEGIELNKRRKASYQSARLLYQLNRFDESLPVFKQLVEFYPDSSEGRLSAELVLDIYNLRGDYSKVAEYAK